VISLLANLNARIPQTDPSEFVKGGPDEISDLQLTTVHYTPGGDRSTTDGLNVTSGNGVLSPIRSIVHNDDTESPHQRAPRTG
jgi:hypothetical protein